VQCPGYKPDEDVEAERVRELMGQFDELIGKAKSIMKTMTAE